MDEPSDDSFGTETEHQPATPVAAPDQPATPEPLAAAAEVGVPPEAAPKRHSWVYHVFNFLFGKETAVGRILRPTIRVLATVVGLVGLGLMAGYFLLYQPTQQAVDSARQQNAALNNQITGLQNDISVLQTSVAASNQAVQGAQDSLTKAQARNGLLVVLYDVSNARTYLAQKDGANLMKTLDQARTDLDAIQPYLQTTKKDLADELNARLETVRSVVVRDATLAQSDLDNLYTALSTADTLLFPQK